MATYFTFDANTIDGKILETSQRIYMKCNLVIPLYQDVVRQYDGNECIVAKKVYLVMYGGHLYGTDQFSNMTDFVEYVRSACFEEECCYLTDGGCYLTFNGQRIVYG